MKGRELTMRFVVYDTISIQKQIFGLPLNLRTDFISKRLLAPFKDIVNAELGIFNPEGPMAEYQESILKLEKAGSLKLCKDALEQSYRCFWEANYTLNLNEVRFGLFLGDPEHKSLMLNKGYAGYRPILGYILLTVWPDDFTLPRLAPAAAHEFNHQMRLSYEPWGNNVSLYRHIVFEGLADSFAASRFGKEMLGPWVTQISARDLEHSKKIIKGALGVSEQNEVGSYMYGDELAKIHGFAPIGLPYAAGYAVGYHLVQAYLKETGKSIVEATMTATEEIIERSGFFE